MAKRITCKVWNKDSEQILTHIGVESEGKVTVADAWRRIKAGEEFYTSAGGKIAYVRACTTLGGTKYITTSPDGIKANNLDELPKCA